MPNKTIALMTAALVLMVLPACEKRGTDLPLGKYESSSRSVDSQGTAYEKNTTTEVEVDSDGNKTATTETETSKDPKGLFNKSTSTTKTTESEEH
jgi:hypothetical protein